MEKPMVVRYKYSDTKINDDLVCDLTEFMDKYINVEFKTDWSRCWYKTYLYNDLSVYTDTICANDPDTHHLTYIIPFRVPGATRGGVILTKLNQTQYKIETIEYITETCFSEKFGCYSDQLVLDAKCFNGKILDFKEVKLNGVES
jgi:hypothetical protein